MTSSRLQLCSLESRRLRFDLCMCYTALFSVLSIFVYLISFSSSTHHRLEVILIKYTSGVALSFNDRVINLWNSPSADHNDFISFPPSNATVYHTDVTPFLLCYSK